MGLKHNIDKKSNILYSPNVFYSSKKTRLMLDSNKNLSKSCNIRPFDSLSQESENNNFELINLYHLIY